MKKKILLAITKGNWGGAQRYVFDLATNLDRETFEIVVLCGAGDQLSNRLQEKGIRVIRLGALNRDIKVSRDVASFFGFYQLLKKEKPDIIHLNSSKVGLIGAITGRLLGIPKIIFTGHGWAWNEDRSFISKSLITIAHWLTIQLSSTTIAVSEKIKREIGYLPFVAESKIIVIYNGVENIEFLERFAARAQIGDQISEKFWIGTISELHKNKGLDNLIQAFADISRAHPDTALIVIGEGEEHARLAALVSKLNLNKKIHLLGFQENASRFLKALDVFVLASRTEAFPYVLLEAGLAQLPVTATRVGGIPELIISGKNGLLVNSGDIDGLKSALTELLEDSAKAATLGHNLRKTVEDKFAVISMVQKTQAVYN